MKHDNSISSSSKKEQPSSETLDAEINNQNLFKDIYEKEGHLFARCDLEVPDCPEQHKKFIEETSLEKLVYWKIQDFIASLPSSSPNDISRLRLLDRVTKHVERSLLALVLRKTKGNLSISAKILGSNRNTLHRKLKEIDLSTKDIRRAIRNSELIKITRK